MSTEQRRTEQVYAVIQALFAEGKTAIRTGDVNTALREQGSPMGTWEVRAEFSRLEELGRIACNADTATWHLTENASLKDAG